ncbi:MAG: LAGLIDADG family homing endonuclease [Thermoproteota archaeon]
MESLMAEVFGMARAPGAGSGCSRLLRYASSPLLGWLELNFPEIARKARRRRVPAEIFQSNEDVAGEFLRSAFLGGGSFGSDAARYVAASKGLAEDYQDLLLKFGIASLVARGVKGAPFKVSVAGSDLVRFEDEIIRSSGSAGAGPPRLFADRCRASGALSRLLAPGRCGAEARPGPIQAEHQRLAEAGKNSALAREALAPKLRLLRVVRARPIPNAGRHGTDWVYDVTVEPTHNFVSHGVLLHNTCSVAKGGIVATLNARTAILAAANPSLGRYDPSKLFIENVNLPPTILSRFDLIFVLKDVPDEEKDRRLADHILGYHRRGLGAGQDVIDQVKLRKYLSYCKKVKPKLTQEAADRLNDFFLEMRRLSLGGSAPMAITPRQLESLIRLSEARAKVFLRSEVLVEDAEAAIALMKKSLVQAGMDVETGQIDVDTLMTGKSKSTRDKMGKLLDLVAKLEASSGSANLDELEGLAEKEGIDRHDFGRLVSAMLREGLLYSPDEQSVKRARR